ncbi:hypothetical protein D9M68_869830 [compost metagenome]
MQRVKKLERSGVTMDTLKAIIEPLLDRIEALEAELDLTRRKGFHVATTDSHHARV